MLVCKVGYMRELYACMYCGVLRELYICMNCGVINLVM
jgi:hypothetical protein